MSLTPDQDEKFREEIAEKEAKDKDCAVKPDIVLSLTITAGGQMTWVMPKDLRMSSYMLKVLDTLITGDLGTRIHSSLQKRDSIKNKILKVFR